MGMDCCANCGKGITLTRGECDHCGWAPASKEEKERLQVKKMNYATMAANLRD